MSIATSFPFAHHPEVAEAAAWCVARASALDAQHRVEAADVRVRKLRSLKFRWTWAPCRGARGRKMIRLLVTVNPLGGVQAGGTLVRLRVGTKTHAVRDLVDAAFTGEALPEAFAGAGSWCFLYEDVACSGIAEVTVLACASALWYALRKLRSVTEGGVGFSAANRKAIEWLADWRREACRKS